VVRNVAIVDSELSLMLVLTASAGVWRSIFGPALTPGSHEFWANFWATMASAHLLLKGNRESER